jgi:hypothetical protein
MDKAQLLSTFNERVEEFDRYQGFIDKARNQVGKFATAVVEKVIKDNEQRCLELVSEIIPLMTDMEQVVADLSVKRATALDSARESQFKLEELELRLAIGDLSEEAFNAEAAEFKAVVDSTDAKVSEYDEETEQFQSAVERWTKIGESAGVLGGGSPPSKGKGKGKAAKPAEPEPADIVFEEPDPVFEPEPDLDMSIPEDDALDALDDEDESESEDDEPALEHDAQSSVAELDVDQVQDGGEVEFDDGGSEDGFAVNDLDLLGDDEQLDVDESASDKEEKPRRAVLLYQEGTAEEQIYPFTGEVMSLGRGRDNDVQVKNDSKVSRYHCKLYRRGPNFYIEDNKSANGTLVNGELITERRLFGGEEVIIGETFFRFRILD